MTTTPGTNADGSTPLDPDEKEGLRFKHVTTREQLDHLEQANIESGLRWLGRHKSTDILNEAFVRELHKKLFGDVWTWAGMFRRTEKNIGIDPTQIAIQLRILLDDAQYWASHKTWSPIEACLRFHHRLALIHPFPNGNGRHARIMTDELMTRVFHGQPIDWSGGYDLQDMNERRTAYIQALRSADRGDYAMLFELAGLDKTVGEEF